MLAIQASKDAGDPIMMQLYSKQFLEYEAEQISIETAQVMILPFPYEGGISYGKGTGQAPDAILEASAYLEVYDEVLDAEPYRVGIATVEPPEIPEQPEAMIQTLYETTHKLLEQGKFVVVIGGDHSISSGYFKAIHEHYGQASAVQLDAHADLRESYEDSPLSHACVMARIRDLTSHTLQIGIRSLSREEAEFVKQEQLSMCYMHQLRNGSFDLEAAIDALPEPVFITVDVDAFDWSVIMSTGTPEPGGLLWDEALSILHKIFTKKNVVGFDVVELSHREHDSNSPFAAAKLIYKMIGMKYERAAAITTTD